MGMLENMIKQLPSKRFGESNVLYFDKTGKNVLVVEQDGMYTYLLESEVDKTYILKKEIDSDMCVDCEVVPENIWVVPQAEAIDGANAIGMYPFENQVSRMMSSMVYEICNYTILTDPNFKGSLFSNSIINIIMINGMGKVYSVPFIVDDGVRGCDGCPCGRIMGEAYQFAPLGLLTESNTFIAKL